jgi:hypothetical protein
MYAAAWNSDLCHWAIALKISSQVIYGQVLTQNGNLCPLYLLILHFDLVVADEKPPGENPWGFEVQIKPPLVVISLRAA